MNVLIRNSHEVLDSYIRPLLKAAVLSGPYEGDMRQREVVSFDTAHQIRIYPPYESHLYFTLKRGGPFSFEEKELVARVVNRLHEYLDLVGESQTLLMAPDIIEDIVAATVSIKCHALIAYILKVYGKWNKKTPYPEWLGHCMGVYLNRPHNKECIFEKVDPVKLNMVKKLRLGPRDLVALDCNGNLLGLETMRQPKIDPQPNALADWTGPRQRVGIRLMPDGDIHIFRHRHLLFMKRAGCWHCLPQLLKGTPQNSDW